MPICTVCSPTTHQSHALSRADKMATSEVRMSDQPFHRGISVTILVRGAVAKLRRAESLQYSSSRLAPLVQVHQLVFSLVRWRVVYQGNWILGTVGPGSKI